MQGTNWKNARGVYSNFFFFPYYYSLGCISLFCENVDIHNAEIMNDFGDRYRSIHGWYVCITDRDCFLGCWAANASSGEIC